jgi:selenocysteine lyase/cysteine desulfurase
MARAADLPATSKELWLWARSQQILEPGAFLDTASLGPILRAALATEFRARELVSFKVSDLSDSVLSGAAVTSLANRVAQFVGCSADELTFTTGTGAALETVAVGLSLNPGDEIISTQHEHAAAIGPWLMQARRRGIVVKQVSLPSPAPTPEKLIEALTTAVTDKTRVLAFAHVQCTDGTLLPVSTLCAWARERNILTVVDGAQALGMVDVSLRDLGCDFYAASFHKWLNGSHGTGLLYVRRENLERLSPVEIRFGTNPFAATEDVFNRSDWPATLRKLSSTLPHIWPALQGTLSAIEFQDLIGRKRIEARVRELASFARLQLQNIPEVELLTPNHPNLWAGIVALRSRRRPAVELARALAGSGVRVRAITNPTLGFEAVRASLHIYNGFDEIERLVAGVKRYATS